MIGRFLDWLLSPLTRRVRREVEAAVRQAQHEHEGGNCMRIMEVGSTEG